MCWRFWLTALALVALAVLPYLVPWLMTPDGYRYSGVSYNTLDSATYLAKMRLGWLGEWRSRLLFTPEVQQVAYLNLYYIFLGHVARLFGLSLIGVYHAARIGGALLLMAALWYVSQQISQDKMLTWWGFWFALVGGGLGWALPWVKQNTVDLWVPEAYGFYAMLVNAHFCMAQFLMVLIFILTERWAFASRHPRYTYPAFILLTVTLSIVQPFGLVTVALTWAGLLGWDVIRQRRISWRPALFLGSAVVTGVLYPLYAVWATAQDPILAGWNAQNVTLSPPWWNWVIGYLLLLPFAAIGIVQVRKCDSSTGRVLVAWLVATLVGIALPISLQRRLSLGLSLPVGLLAGLGWQAVLARFTRGRFLAKAVLFTLTLTTPLVLIVAGVAGVTMLPIKDLIYVSEGELAAARSWLDTHARRDQRDVFLASATRGELLPWMLGQQVVVGHPMETLDYERRSGEARAFFDGTWTQGEQHAYLCREGVDYVWVGPVEREIAGGVPFALEGASLFLQNRDVAVYAVTGLCDAPVR